MTTTRLTSSEAFTNGRLVVDEDMAFDLLEMIENRRVLLLQVRADLREAGLERSTAHLSDRLARLRRLSKRVERLVDEKGWGEASRPPQTTTEEA